MSFDLAPWRPYERVMRDYFHGKTDASLVIYDDFERDEAAIEYFFRDEAGFSPVDRAAVDLCQGRVLDVGAGSGCHSLVLQQRGLEVVALETLPALQEILRARGVRDVRPGSIFGFTGGTFDTVLMMMNGLGIAETLQGLDVLLQHARLLLRNGGQLLADSCDVRNWDTAGRPRDDQLYLDDGRYIGELHIQLEYEGEKAPPFPQLYIDTETLARITRDAGWDLDIVTVQGPQYLARLTPR